MPESIVTLIVALAAFAAGLLANRQSQNRFHSSIVSHERMEWVKDMRSLCAELCTICDQYAAWSAIPAEQKTAFLRARNGMLLRLSGQKEYPADQELIGLLGKDSYEEVKAGVPRIRKLCMSMFKAEWDKVKTEAGGSPLKAWAAEKARNMLKARKNGDGAPEN